ncbi:hypothetical protein Cgig2_033743 [Carnegiea gigantea]|uniref:Uncharacterized protein n=1 Tax=Carnegiea gigantea TaxID=171969 RepID=A0A9Q1K1N1_9CARY|nr:hypothetical protein Cgig2_033743 [Carnegiea gigantea]
MDTLKSLMSNMVDTITRQVSEQVKKVMDTAGSVQPVPAEGFLHRPESRSSFHPGEHGREGPCVAAPTMVFGGKDAPKFASPHNDPLVVEMKIASAIVGRILVDTGNSDCLNRLLHPRRDLVPMANPILGFGGQKVNPTGTIRLPVCFGDKNRFKSLEVDFSSRRCTHGL